VSELPGLFAVRVKARSIAYLYATGATLGLLTLAFPHADEVRDAPLVVLAGIAYAIGVAVWLLADRLEDLHMHAVLLAGTVIVSLANYYAGPATLYPLLYMWTALYAFYFFPMRAALAQVAFVGVAYAVVLAVQDADMVIVSWLLAVGTPFVAGVLISRLLGGLQLGARELSESEERTRLVLDTAPDAFVTLDRDGCITTWNAAAEQLFGWSK
jgi:PAS domain-containing protein